MSYESRTKDSAAGAVARVRHLAKTAGEQRKLFLAALSQGKEKDYLFTVPYGKAAADISVSGAPLDRNDASAELSSDELSALTSFGLSQSLRAIVTPGAAPLNKTVGGIPVPCGVCAIVAKGGVGKTPLAHYLASSGVDSYGIVRVGEPFAGYITNHKLIAAELGAALIRETDVVLDSIKDLLAGGDSLMKGGISRAALVAISSWASLAASVGSTIYVPLNPSGDRELIDLMAEAAVSNATMAVWNVEGGPDWKWAARTGEAMPRLHGSLKFENHEGDDETDIKHPSGQDKAIGVKVARIDSSAMSSMINRSKTL